VKDKDRYVHGFGIPQIKDRIVLETLAAQIGVTSRIIWNNKGFYSLDVLDARSLKLVKDYFFDTMKGVKSYDYKV
jgi:hypothetical protein